jgi:hypothetical protein
MIDNMTIQRIKDASNVVDVISDFHDLKHIGSGSYGCLCPFHDDRHMGNFVVSEAKNYYRCFACGAHGTSIDYLMYGQQMSFTDAIRWLAAKYGIAIEDMDAKSFRLPPTVCKPHTPPPPLPTLELPKDMVTKLKVGDGRDTFCDWLRGLPWTEEEAGRIHRVLNNYLVGHGKDGHTIFWQVDEGGHVRTGKMMLYKPDGHRDKTSHGNFDHVHSRLLRNHYWDDEKAEVQTCLFGQHLLDYYPDATVNIVESEKTALICAIAYGDDKRYLWMASGGKSGLQRAKLEALISRDRYIILYPDKDAADDWRQIASTIGYDRLAVNTAMMDKYWEPQDGPKADFADVITRRLYERKNGKPGTMLDLFCQENPQLRVLVDKLQLTPITKR